VYQAKRSKKGDDTLYSRGKVVALFGNNNYLRLQQERVGHVTFDKDLSMNCTVTMRGYSIVVYGCTYSMFLTMFSIYLRIDYQLLQIMSMDLLESRSYYSIADSQ
jgi:hypothetical protein